MTSLSRGTQDRDPEELRLRRAGILSIVRDVENVTQIHISEDERAALVSALESLGETLEETKNRAKAVCRAKDYGRIAFNVWFNASEVYTKTEAYTLARKIISDRRDRLRDIHVSEDKLITAGLCELQEYYNRKYEAEMERVKEGLKKRIKRVRAFIIGAPEDIKLEIKKIAENKGLMKDDLYWRASLPYLCAELLLDVEMIMRRVPTAKSDV